MTNSQTLVETTMRGNDAPAACFLNSLARECSSVVIIDGECEAYYCIPLSNEHEIRIPLRVVSSIGLHEYQFPAVLYGTEVAPIEFDQVVDLVVEQPALVGMITPEQKSIFVDRVNESYRNVYAAVKDNPYGRKLFEERLNFRESEQGLLIGHSFHPAPKSREQFSPQDAQVYTPEFGGKFQLHWLAVDESLLVSGSSGDQSVRQRIEELVTADENLEISVAGLADDHEMLFPVHPWQWQSIKQRKEVRAYLKEGQIRDLGAVGEKWYPTSSTRSLYSPKLPYMLKFSLSVKLTNSVRNLSLKEVVRGTRLNQLFEDTELKSLLGGKRGFQLMQEPAFLGLMDSNGLVIDESLLAFRDNPLMGKPEEEAVVLATLTQQNPFGGQSLLVSRIEHYARTHTLTPKVAAQRWFDAYCKHAVVPLFNLQANYGIVFLAHQQNIVMQLEEGLPIGMYYRDCQGTGYTDLAFELFPDALGCSTNAKHAKQETENYWNQDKVRRYFAYYLIINSTFSAIASIAAGLDIDESSLVTILRQHLVDLKTQGVKDDRCLNYVLDSDSLCCKGNFYCYLQNFNENSIPDPTVIYFDLSNPIVAVKEANHA
ncbi:IucA/IucC family protein [Vibrio genomosp. F10 str. 9ZC157]|uniref:IucA/IucC family protein n=1 Tax=Vibrio genomosp. F10 TaxID=723171 RepID=UPI0002F8F98E|nr:IucA/IucC family protein [Vibrio genomosp. F10]OEE97654.1 N(2)-citryl-N(6)-acetyl-N(6)-hydroxylysine synthase [Vibrio genomosp. F10 str. 9ZC157]